MSDKKKIAQKEKEQREREWFDFCIKNELSYDEFLNGSHPTTAREEAGTFILTFVNNRAC